MKKILTEKQADALREVMTIGAGNAATALSQMIKRKSMIAVPRVDMVKIGDAPKIFGGPERLITSVYLQILGDITGVLLFSFSKEEAIKLSDLLLDKPAGKTKLLGEMAQSAIKETMAILAGAYLSAMSKVFNMRLLISSPSLASDMAGAIIDNILIETSKDADHVIIVDTEFEIRDEKVQAFFCFVPDVSSMQKLLKALHI
jgi:chemotaxis protein CheC